MSRPPLREVTTSLMAFLATGLLATLTTTPPATAANVPPSTPKRASDPVKGLDSQPAAPPLSGYLLSAQLDKAKKAAQDVKTAGTSASLGARQRAQTTSYYCGPAAVAQVLAHRSISSSQATLASQLNTTVADGTAWYGVYSDVTPPRGKTLYPIPDVLNWRIGGDFTYVPRGHATPTSSGSSIVTDFKAYVVSDIYANGTAVVGNAWEPKDGTGPRLTGHPRNQLIFHWYSIYGYSSSGATMSVEDPASSPAVSWGAGVPPTSSKSAFDLAVINGGRGYVW